MLSVDYLKGACSHLFIVFSDFSCLIEKVLNVPPTQEFTTGEQLDFDINQRKPVFEEI